MLSLSVREILNAVKGDVVTCEALDSVKIEDTVNRQQERRSRPLLACLPSGKGGLVMPTFFADTVSAVSASDWSSVITAMTSQISVATIVGVLATLVAAGIGLVFMWWGVRKAIGSLMTAFRKGKMKV